MKRITVFCGSSFGTEKIYELQAYQVGKKLAEKGTGLVYGGAKVGLMGAVANGAIDHGGEVIGVLPRFLQGKEIAQENLTELILVDTMHERKMRMNELSDGFISLPGGFGTMEECFEILTWAQLGLHTKPVALLNVNGFYNELLALIRTMVDKGFLKEINRQMLLTGEHIDDLLADIWSYKAPLVSKWIKKGNI